jgi:acyl-CoA reductase-like NAD-dependent aldehyde dehydrogenase
MSDFWSDELTPEKETDLLRRAARDIKRRKMETPAIMALEMHKPIANTLASGAVVFAPFLVPFFGFDKVNEYSQLFSKRENVERLLELLESSESFEDSTEESDTNSPEKSVMEKS